MADYDLENPGFIVLKRSILGWEWYDHLPTKVLFIHCLLRANFEDAKWRGITVKRGEFITGRIKLSEETGLTERQVRTGLKNLQNTGEVSIKTTKKYSIISITNYAQYQDKRPTDDQQSAIKRPSSDQQTTTSNNNNNNNNTILDPPKNSPDDEMEIPDFLKREKETKPDVPKKRKSKISDDWVLTEKRREVAEEYAASKGYAGFFDWGDQTGRFIAHHQQHGKLMLDWEAAWRTWYMNAVKFTKEKSNGRTDDPASVTAAMRNLSN